MGGSRQPLQPIFTAHLFPELEAKLIELLRSLAPEDWEKQTTAPKWKVKDVAAHLLDTQTRKLAAARHGYKPENSKKLTPEKLVALINTLNAEGVRQYRQLAPQELILRMETASQESAAFHMALDPFAPAMFPVSWAGEEKSLNWFDTAREFTERWHHQQQIRLAANRPGIMTPELYHPVLDCFVRGLPHLYRDVDAPKGSLLVLEISGECGGRWFLRKGPSGWGFVKRSDEKPASRVKIPEELAWRAFTKGIDRESARAQIAVEGNRDLGEKVLQLTAIVG